MTPMNNQQTDKSSMTTVKSSYQYAKVKGWDTVEKVKRHNRKLTAEIRELAKCLPGLKSVTKRDIIRAAHSRLASMPDLLSSPRQTMHFITATFTRALEIDRGKLLSIETAWDKLMDKVSKLNPDVAET